MMVAAAALAVALPGCASSDLVIDSTTGKPIADVFVVSRWAGEINLGAEGQGTCYSVAATTTDASGVFHLSSWSGNFHPLISHRVRVLIFYKTGYRGPADQLQTEGPFELTLDHRQSLSRMQWIINQMEVASCGTEEEQKAQLLPFYRAAYAELGTLAPQPAKTEQVVLFNALFEIEALEIPYVQAQRNLVKRRTAAGIR